VEQVAHLAVAGEEALAAPGLTADPEAMAPVCRQITEQQLRRRLEVKRTVVDRQ
jgi:hypothetical protein